MPVQPFKPFTMNLGPIAPGKQIIAATTLQLSPTLTETWSVEALLVNLTARYQVKWSYVNPPVYNELALQIAHLENQTSALIGQRGQIEKGVTASEAGEVGLPPGKELDNQQVQTWGLRAQVSAINGEIEAAQNTINQLKKERGEYGLNDGFAAIEAPSLDLLLVIQRGGETVFIDHLQTTRVVDTISWATSLGELGRIELEGNVTEYGAGRISFPIPVGLGPGESLDATLTATVLNPKRGGTLEPQNRGIGISGVPGEIATTPRLTMTELSAAYTEETNPRGNQ